MKSYEPTSFHVFVGERCEGMEYYCSKASLDDAKKYVEEKHRACVSDEWGSIDYALIMVEDSAGQLIIIEQSHCGNGWGSVE